MAVQINSDWHMAQPKSLAVVHRRPQQMWHSQKSVCRRERPQTLKVNNGDSRRQQTTVTVPTVSDNRQGNILVCRATRLHSEMAAISAVMASKPRMHLSTWMARFQILRIIHSNPRVRDPESFTKPRNTRARIRSSQRYPLVQPCEATISLVWRIWRQSLLTGSACVCWS